MTYKYSDVRHHLRTGDIVLFSGKGLISRGIKRVTNSEWSHIGMVLDIPEYNMVLLWESTTLSKMKDIYTQQQTSGVQIVSLSERIQTFDGNKISIRMLEGDRTQEQINEVLALRDELRGRPYERSKIQLFLSALTFINFRQDRLNSVFCSELVAESYQRAGWMEDVHASNSYAPERFSQATKNPVPMKPGFKLSKEIEIQIGQSL